MRRNKLFDFDISLAQSCKGYSFVGIDEVGRGSLAGPVIACAFSWKVNICELDGRKNRYLLLKLNDSKQLNKEEREKLFEYLIRLGDFALGYSSVLEIEKLNILNATYLAMRRAYDELFLNRSGSNINPYVLIDGNKFNPFINSRQLPIIQGDSKSSLLAAASVIAKVYRDKLMLKLSELNKCKKYGWGRNKGYGTNLHKLAIQKYGITPFHRKLFIRKTVSTLMNEANCFK